MTSIKHLIIAVLALLLAGGAYAQQTITGVVKTDDGQPAMYANVVLLRAADSLFVRGTTTNEQGEFGLPADTAAALLRVTAIGYATHYQSVGTSPVSITLKKGATTLNEVSITADRPLYSVDGEKDLYNVSEDPSVQTGSASDALQNSPGVQVDVEGNITLNGSSVDVWINDRPLHLSGEALKQYIKTLPANDIDRIEVIKNPSAKYGGGTPVVNIITNHKILKNSFFSFGANANSTPSVSPWMSYVYSNEKFSINAYISGNYNSDICTEDKQGQMFNADSILSRSYNEHTAEDEDRFYSWISLNASYQFDSMNSVSGWFSAYPSWATSVKNGRQNRTEYLVNADGSPADYSYNISQRSTSTGSGGHGGLEFVHLFNNEGHQIALNASGDWWGYSSRDTLQRNYLSLPQLNFAEQSSLGNFSGSGSVGIDYTLPYSEDGELEAGINLMLDQEREFWLRDTMLADGSFRTDILRSDTSNSPEHYLSAYLTWSRTWGNFTLKLGGRANYETSRSGHSGHPEFDTTVSFFTATPSLHMSYRTESLHNFSLGYTYRVATPSASEFCRYVQYDIEGVRTGNPLLTPTYVHNLDASWNKYFEKFGSVGISGDYRAQLNTSAPISDVRYVDFFGRNVTYTMPYNVGDSRRGDLYVNVMYRPTAFFNVRLSGGITDNWYLAQVRPDKWVEDNMLSWSMRLRLWAKLWNKVEVFANGRYQTRQQGWDLLNIIEPQKSIDLGASADLFKHKLSLYLSMNDIFNWNNWSLSYANPYNTSTDVYNYTTRYITFGATLRFGKMELESQAETGAREAPSGK